MTLVLRMLMFLKYLMPSYIFFGGWGNSTAQKNPVNQINSFVINTYIFKWLIFFHMIFVCILHSTLPVFWEKTDLVFLSSF